MEKSFLNLAEMDRQREKEKESFEKNVPDSLFSEYTYYREQLKKIEPRKQAELNKIHKQFDATKEELRSKAKDCLEKMSELTGISTWDLTSSNFVGGYYFND